MDTAAIISLMALLLTGIGALWGTISFILRYVETVRRDLLQTIERLEDSLRVAIATNKLENTKAQQRSVTSNTKVHERINTVNDKVEQYRFETIKRDIDNE